MPRICQKSDLGACKVPTKVIMPKLGLTMQKGIVVGWKTKEDDTVEKGKALFSIETEKVIVDIESPASGVLKRIFGPVGSIVAVGGLIAIISEPNEVVSNLDELAQEAEKAFIQRAAAQISATQAQAAPTHRERMLISPLIRPYLPMKTPRDPWHYDPLNETL